MITRALRRSRIDQLEAEEGIFLLLADLSGGAFATEETAVRLGPAARIRVERARALLATAPAERWDLRTLGKIIGCSPYHLARQFRVTTGDTISHYLLRLRLALAVERLADGERDIATLALDTGFAHHSHFSARFRATFGVTPMQARDTLTNGTLRGLRTIVIAGMGHAP